MPSIGEFIKVRRAQLGMSGTELARQIGSTPACVSNWECIKNRGPSKDFLIPLAKALRVSVDDLISNQGPPPENDHLSSDERGLLSIYRKQGTLEKALLMRMLKGLTE